MEKKIMKTKLTCLVLLLVLAGNALAQSNNEQQLPCTMSVKLLEVKHRSAQMLADVLAGLLSGPGGGRIVTPNQTLKTLTVRDCAANIAMIEQALAKLDVPEQSPANMEFQLHLLTASNKAADSTAMPKQLEPVVAQLKGTLKYANYRYVYSALNRISNGGKVESSGVTGELFPAPSGVANAPGNPSFYQYALNNVKFTQDATGKDSVQIEFFKFGISVPIQVGSDRQIQYKDIGLVTPLSLREGEIAVVGTANISGSDEAMIVVVSVKKLK
jgi:Bacterial type II/III secretion system short domain